MVEMDDLSSYARPCVTVDLVILTVVACDPKVLLIRRKVRPFEGMWALPGGFVRVSGGPDQGEDLEAAALRELQEETGLRPGSVFLEQLHTFGKSRRDPRTRVITVAYYALVRADLAPFVVAGGDASDVSWFSLGDIPGLAFDHNDIVTYALQWIRARLKDSDVALELVPDPFTVSELRAVYEVILGEAQDPANFRRSFQRLLDDGLVVEAPGKRVTSARPARVYRFAAPRRAGGS